MKLGGNEEPSPTHGLSTRGVGVPRVQVFPPFEGAPWRLRSAAWTRARSRRWRCRRARTPRRGPPPRPPGSIGEGWSSIRFMIVLCILSNSERPANNSYQTTSCCFFSCARVAVVASRSGSERGGSRQRRLAPVRSIGPRNKTQGPRSGRQPGGPGWGLARTACFFLYDRAKSASVGTRASPGVKARWLDPTFLGFPPVLPEASRQSFRCNQIRLGQTMVFWGLAAAAAAHLGQERLVRAAVADAGHGALLDGRSSSHVPVFRDIQGLGDLIRLKAQSISEGSNPGPK